MKCHALHFQNNMLFLCEIQKSLQAHQLDFMGRTASQVKFNCTKTVFFSPSIYAEVRCDNLQYEKFMKKIVEEHFHFSSRGSINCTLLTIVQLKIENTRLVVNISLAYLVPFTASIVNGKSGSRMAFSCTCQPNMYDVKDT